jgi:hypothetical protein
MAALKEIKRVKNAVLLVDAGGVEFVRIDNLRLSYPAYGAAKEETDDNGAKVILPNGKAKTAWGGIGLGAKATHTEAKDLVKEVFMRLLAANPGAKVPQSQWAMKDGDHEDIQSKNGAEINAGHWMFSHKDSTRRPPVRDAKGDLVLEVDKIDEMFYGGCWADLLVRPWYFNGKPKGSTKDVPKRLLLGINGVKFRKDDTPFGNGVVNEEDVWDTSGDDSGSSSMDDDGDL